VFLLLNITDIQGSGLVHIGERRLGIGWWRDFWCGRRAETSNHNNYI